MSTTRLPLCHAIGVLCASVAIACGPTPTRAPRPSAPPVASPPPVPADSADARKWHEASGVLARRCVVCHGCYDAPCQLQLGTFEGIERGASKVLVYDGARLFAIPPTRLGVDAHGVAAWREKGFHPVLPEGQAEQPAASLLVRMLELKRQNPLPVSERLPDNLTVGLDREQVCPTPDEYDDFASDHPLWGMPYALPGLSDAEHATLLDWARAGTPHPPPPKTPPAIVDAIERWERFLNQESNKGRLMARYIYEHLFLGSLYFEGTRDRYYRLVRARNRTGAVDEIATRRPFDDPGTEAVYYRLVPREGPVLAKTHMPYELSNARLARWRELFLHPDYEVTALPSYDPELSANPFAAFAELPVRARYRFMLEEAQFTIGGFIKGPVCRGQVALDVIEDRFWMTFVAPESPIVEREAAFLSKVSPDLRMPAEQGSNARLITWVRYARREASFLKAKNKFLASVANSPNVVTLAHIWDGDDHNDNAALTVFRHYDSATVVKGLLGGPPKTTWVVSYGILERIHYLLVAGFDVFGNIGHQLHTRLYMDFLRMEAEHNFLLLLPSARRRPLVEHWYRDTSNRVKDFVYGKVASFEQETGLTYRTATPELELSHMLEDRLGDARERKYELTREPDARLRSALERLAQLRGRAATWLPETSFLEVTDGSASHHFSVLRESAHTNVAHLFREEKRRVPDEDGLTVLRGFVGAYPNVLFRVASDKLEAFVDAVHALDSLDAYAALRARYSIRRTNPGFWAHSDRVHEAYRKLEPREAGLFDYNRLDDQ